jgi:hypothetical protein
MLGIAEILLILICLALIIAVANYGKDTALGYWGTVVLALFTSPLVAFLIIWIFLKNKRNI